MTDRLTREDIERMSSAQVAELPAEAVAVAMTRTAAPPAADDPPAPPDYDDGRRHSSSPAVTRHEIEQMTAEQVARLSKEEVEAAMGRPA